MTQCSTLLTNTAAAEVSAKATLDTTLSQLHPLPILTTYLPNIYPNITVRLLGLSFAFTNHTIENCVTNILFKQKHGLLRPQMDGTKTPN